MAFTSIVALLRVIDLNAFRTNKQTHLHRRLLKGFPSDLTTSLLPQRLTSSSSQPYEGGRNAITSVSSGKIIFTGPRNVLSQTLLVPLP